MTQNQQTGALTLVALVVGGVIVYALVGDDDDGRDTVTQPDQKPTISQFQADTIANRIYAAFWEGSWFYEDEETMIAAILDCNNDADVALVTNAYGVREGPNWLDVSANLAETFAYALDDEEADYLNEQLRRKGIRARF
jgi:hypothetical protein